MRFQWLYILALAAGVLVEGMAPEAAQQPEPRDDQWALLVGINDYPGDIQDLSFARNDAIVLQDLLISAAGFREDHILLLTDEGEARATKQNILAAVDQSLLPKVQPGHQVILFLAGHGITRGLGTEARGYFLPVDVDAQSEETIAQTGLDLAEFAQHLGALPASQFTLFVDACRQDPFPGRGIKGNTMTDVIARGFRDIVREGRLAAPAQPEQEPPTAVIFYSCQVGQRAYESPQLEHGVFTYYILRGIQELANQPDGRVEAGCLAGYLRDHVRQWAEEYRQEARFAVEQTPTMVATEVRGPMVIVRVTPFAPDVPPPPGEGLAVLATSPEGASLTLNGEPVGSGPLQKGLPPGEYTVRAEQSGYEPAEAKISVLPGYQQEFTLTLKPTATDPTAQSHYEKGVQAAEEELWPQAIAYYELALHGDPDSLATQEQLAHACLQSARYRDGVDRLWSAVQKFPDNADLLARYSRSLSTWAQVDEKQDRSINERPQPANRRDPQPISRKNARKEALAVAELATQQDPQWAAAHLALGYALLQQKNGQPKALAAFGRASALAPGDPETYFSAGYTYRLMKDYPQAIPSLKKALELRPDYYEAHRELAYCYHAADDTEQATREYQVASGYRRGTHDSGEVAGIHLALSTLYTQTGQQIGGAEGQAFMEAGKGYEAEARWFDPDLKAALEALVLGGVGSRIRAYLPTDLQDVLGRIGIRLPSLDLPW